jgi:type III restriction enzyme
LTSMNSSDLPSRSSRVISSKPVTSASIIRFRPNPAEEHFLVKLKGDPKVVFYFKFPDNFRLAFPKIIGDYIPDWGIARYDDGGKVVLQLVRETKGDTDLNALRFPQEKRKIVCAKKHFDTIGIDYRPVTDKTPNWWHPEADQKIFKL